MVSMSNVHSSGGFGSGCQPAMLPAKTGNSTLLPVRLVDDPTADLQAPGQLPLAHPLRPLSPDLLPLPLAQDGLMS